MDKNMSLMPKIMMLFSVGLIVSAVVFYLINRSTIIENSQHSMVTKARAIATEAENARVF